MDRKQIELRAIALIEEQLVPDPLNHNVPRVNRPGRTHEGREDGVSGKDGGFVLVGEAADDRVISGGNLEEITVFEAFKTALILGSDAVKRSIVELECTAEKEVLGFGDGEGELGEGGEGDLVEHVPFGLDVDGGFQRLTAHHVVGVGAVIIIVTVAASAFLLGLTLFGFNFLVAALRELALLLEPPLRAELGLRGRLAIDETEGGVVIGGAGGREGVVVGEIEDGIGRVLGAVLVGVVEVGASPVGDTAKLIGTGERGEGDVDREVKVEIGGIRRAPSVWVEWDLSNFELSSSYHHYFVIFVSEKLADGVRDTATQQQAAAFFVKPNTHKNE